MYTCSDASRENQAYQDLLKHWPGQTGFFRDLNAQVLMWQTCLVKRVVQRGPELMESSPRSPRQCKFFECYNDSAHKLFLNKNTSMEFSPFRPSVLSSFYWLELTDSKVIDEKDKKNTLALTPTNTHREYNFINSISLGSKTKTEVFI